MSPHEALNRLKDGNARFVAGKVVLSDRRQQVAATASAQNPFAIVLACIDSRVAPEIVFDTGIGDIFTACVAGNVVNQDVLAGMEFAVDLAGAKLIVILGHSSCGAIQGACDGVELGNLTQLLDKIRPAVDRVRRQQDKEIARGGEQRSGPEFEDRVSHQNVLLGVRAVREQSSVIAGALRSGEVHIVGAMYEIATGEVRFLEGGD